MSPDHELEMLLSRLEKLQTRVTHSDAIDDAIAAAPRLTATTSLRKHEVVEKFRGELADGLIRTDTANQLLGLVRAVLDAAVMP